MPSLIGATSGGVSIAANYLKAVQSPGAAYDGLNGTATSPLLTFSTPNLRGYKVVITGVDITVTPEAANSDYSKVVRALQVTSELFAVFAPSVSGGGDSTIVYMAPDFNTNPGTTAGDPVTGTENFTILEAAISGALAGAPAVAVTTSTCTGVTWS
jgi:hypothetical protein